MRSSTKRVTGGVFEALKIMSAWSEAGRERGMSRRARAVAPETASRQPSRSVGGSSRRKRPAPSVVALRGAAVPEQGF